MAKIKVSICTGTTCYVMGASELLLLEEELPTKIKDLVDIEGVTCLELCKSGNNSKAPYVLIDGEVHEGATLQGVIEIIKEKAC